MIRNIIKTLIRIKTGKVEVIVIYKIIIIKNPHFSNILDQCNER